jgi:hypothetical protein
MIIPKPREDQKEQRRVAVLSTTVLVLCFALVLVLVDLPEERPARDLYREIDVAELAQFMPEPEPEISQEEPEDASEDPSETEQPERAVEDAEPQQAPERVRLDDVQLDGFDERTPMDTPSRERRRSSADSDPGGTTGVEVERRDVGADGGFETLGDVSNAPTPRGRRGGNGGAGEPGIALGEGSGAGAASGDGGGIGDGTPIAGGSRARGGQDGGIAVEVGLRDLDDFGDNYENVDLRLLIEWMRDNPAELPPGVRRHVGYEPNHLSSVIYFEIGGRAFELYLMCIESRYEVHVVLVEEGETTYLIDRSFQQQSRSLRVGSVQRTEGEIVSIQSRQEAAGSGRADEFYQFFLSWWEETKENYDFDV